MALRRVPGSGVKRNGFRGLPLLLMAAALSACSWLPDYANPIEWFRDASGAAQDDAQDQGQRNIKNLEAGSKAPYPNLATVPPPPDNAMSTVDREKLQQGLVADRAHAKYSDAALHQGLPVPEQTGGGPQVAALPTPASAAPSPGPASAAPAAPGAGAAPGAAAGAAPSDGAAAGAAPGAAAGTAPNGGAAPRAAHHGPPAKGSAPAPEESSLTSPSIGGLPVGEAPHSAPPPPGGRQPAAPRQQAALEPPALRAPAAPAVAPSAPPVMRAPGGKHASVTLEAAEIAFAGDGKTLSAGDMQHLSDVAKLQKEGGGSLRVIGYGKRGTGSDAAEQQLQSFGQALDRANAVMEALTKLGVPGKLITVQAAPELANGGLAAGQVVVLLEY